MTILYVYIRHAPKEYRNGYAPQGKYQHDAPILATSIDQCHEMGKNLIQSYGFPKMIVVSPFYRTRQTAKEMMVSGHVSTNHIFVDTNVSEFLGNQQGYIDVNPETFGYCKDDAVTLAETIPDLRRRVEKHLEMMQIIEEQVSSPPDDSYRVIWIVTHGLVISTVYDILKSNEFKGCDQDKYYPHELEGLVVKISGRKKKVGLLREEIPFLDEESGA